MALPTSWTRRGRRQLAHVFAAELVGHYEVAADVAIHAPHREGDKRNWHAHVMTTTRKLEPEGLTDKTRVLDAQATRGVEVTHMRERLAALQNDALERHGHAERVDHRSLAAQREVALARGDERTAETLDRPAEMKLGPTVSAIERREERAAEREGREYVPLTERGAKVHEARQVRSLLAELTQLRESWRERAELARETYNHAREEGAARITAGLAALRVAAQRHEIGPSLAYGRESGQHPRHEREASAESIKERLARIMGREASHHAQDGPAAGLSAHGEGRQNREQGHGTDAIRERLSAVLGRERPVAQREEPKDGFPALGQERERTRGLMHEAHELDPIRARLAAVLARERPVAREREAPVVEREDPLALVVERLREERADAPSFATPLEARAFREELERRFDPGTLARLGRGEEVVLAQIADDQAGRAVPGQGVPGQPRRADALGGAHEPGLPDQRRADRRQAREARPRGGRARARAVGFRRSSCVAHTLAGVSTPPVVRKVLRYT